MIEKSRLEELIEQGATIYKVRDNMIIDYQLCSYNYLEENYLIYENVMTNYYRSWIGKLDDLFETKEQAEWALKYHATRTEELDLPTWEEFDKNNKTIYFIAKDWQCYELGFAFGDTETICLDKVVLGVNTNQKTWKATEENYIKACDLCVKLFKGESDEKTQSILV